MRYVIIGSGVAGIAAIEAIRSVDKVSEVAMIGDDPHGFYSRPGLAYFLTGELHDKALFPRTADDYRRMNFRYVRGRVANIRPEQHSVELGDQTNLAYDKLLIAVGAQALPLEVPGADLVGVLKLDHMEDAKSILKHARAARRRLLLGEVSRRWNSLRDCGRAARRSTICCAATVIGAMSSTSMNPGSWSVACVRTA